MAARMRGKRARLGALAAACAAMLALAVALGVTQRGDAPGATAQTATTPTTALPANPPTCTTRTLGVSRASNPGLVADCDTLLAIQSTLRVTGWLDYDRADWRDHGAWLNWSAAAPMRFWQVITLGGTPQRVTGLDAALDAAGRHPHAAGQPDGAGDPRPGRERADRSHPDTAGQPDEADAAGPVGQPADGEHPHAAGQPGGAHGARPVGQPVGREPASGAAGSAAHARHAPPRG